MATRKIRTKSNKSEEIVDIESVVQKDGYLLFTMTNGKQEKMKLLDRYLFDSDEDYNNYINSTTK